MKRQSADARGVVGPVHERDVQAASRFLVDVGSTQKGLMEFMSDSGKPANRNVVVFGEVGAGKTTFMVDALQSFISQQAGGDDAQQRD